MEVVSFFLNDTGVMTPISNYPYIEQERKLLRVRATPTLPTYFTDLIDIAQQKTVS